ncbi:MAG: hypothetical protein ACNS60_10850 [Candidatus Cyclobacteriaceae bacterium M2_1C_046]
MKFLIQMILTLLLGLILAQFLPFWSVAIAGFVAGLFIKINGFKSFFAGFLGIALLWGFSAWFISSANNHILMERIAGVFTLSPALLLLLTSVLGGLIGGFAAASGTQLRHVLFPGRKRKNPYYGV